MKRILFPTLLIATLLAGGAVAFAIWRSSPATAEDFIKEAQKAYDEKDYETAKIQALRAVQEKPRDRTANFLLFDSYVNQGDLANAAKQMRSFLDFEPENREANLKLGNLYLR